MKIDVKDEGSKYLLNIEGPIKSVNDSAEIKSALDKCVSSSNPIYMEITNSFSVTSSVIGFLLKKIQADGFKINIKVSDERLFELFETLNLVETLNVQKI